MKKNTLTTLAVIAGAAGLLIYWLRRKATAAENVIIELQDIAIDMPRTKQARYLTIYYNVKLKLINNEPADINVRQVNFNVKLNDKNFGRAVRNVPFRVPRRGETIQSFQVAFTSFGIFGILIDIITKGLNFDFDINGYINTDLGKVDMQFNKSYSVDTDFLNSNGKFQDARINGIDILDLSTDYNTKKKFI